MAGSRYPEKRGTGEMSGVVTWNLRGSRGAYAAMPRAAPPDHGHNLEQTFCLSARLVDDCGRPLLARGAVSSKRNHQHHAESTISSTEEGEEEFV